jgi:WD40 repeat protein
MNDGWPDPAIQGEGKGPEPTARPAASRPPKAATLQIPDHELISCVGRGSYGEVWLARTILGEFRAVKVIYRHAFEHDRPFEREFEGIRKFEPVSRAHPSQLNVFHVGRNDVAGYFYYVMELADDGQAEGTYAGSEDLESGQRPVAQQSSPPPLRDPSAYIPHTLKLHLLRRERLSFDECLKIGLGLTTALEHLHEHGLVHRDIKPSNIIFVKGTPKLADIGLVATMDATMSCVGTSGFLPPEGPGTAQGDLYSLGKVLYEMAMGRDRQEFPKLPADLAEFSDPARLLELNAVVLKACHSDPRKRYQSAKELAADLLLLQRGHSVRRLRTVERRLVFVTRAGAAVSAMLLLAAALYWNAARQERATARQLYVADMNHALQSWEGGNVALARELLEAHRQRHPELLGFEWRLIAGLCQQSDARFTLRGHARTVWSVAFSPDGQTLATGSGDHTVKLWDTATGRLTHTLAGHQSFVHALAISPAGNLLASGSRDFTIKLWDTMQHTQTATLAGHMDAVRAVAFSPLDGRFLVSGGEDKTLRWWSLATTQEVACVATGFTVEQVAFSPDGRRLSAGSADGKIHSWSCATREEQSALALHRTQVLGLAYSSEGRLLASGGYDGTIKLWDTVAGREVAALGRGAPVFCLAFAPGDKLLAAATEDGLVRLWDVARYEAVSTLRGHTANVRALAFSPKGGLLASGDEDGLAKLWTVPPSPGRENALIHDEFVNSLAFSPDGRTLASTAPKTDTLRLWEVSSQREQVAAQADQDAVWCVGFAPDGQALATGGRDGTVRLWNATNLSELAVFRGHRGGIDSICFSPDGRLIASGSRDLTAKVWERATGRELASLHSLGGVVRAVAFSGRILATGSGGGHIHFWRTDSFEQSASIRDHLSEVRALEFSPNGRILASGGADRVIRLWDVRQGTLLGRLADHTAMISSLAFAPDMKTLASGSWDSTVKLWNLRLLREVATLRAHSGQVTQVGFSPDGNTLASASSDGTIRLWHGVPAIENFQRGVQPALR